MSNRGLWIALGASMAINLFVIGAVVGAVGMRARQTAERAAPAPVTGNPLLRAGDRLPPQVRAAYRTALRQESATSQAQLASARQARLEAARLMAAPSFDPQATLAAFEQARTAEVAARSALEGAVVQFATHMKPEERQVLAQGIRQPPGGGRGGGRGGRGGGGPNGPPPLGAPMEGSPEGPGPRN